MVGALVNEPGYRAREGGVVHALPLTLWGLRGAKVPLRKVGDGWPPYRNLLISQKEISVPPNPEEKEGLSLWNVGETPGDKNASAMRDGIPAVFQA